MLKFHPHPLKKKKKAKEDNFAWGKPLFVLA